MFLHKKRAKPSAKRLKLELKLDFEPNAEALRGGCNAFKDGKGLISRYIRNEMTLFSKPLQVIGTSEDVVYILQDDAICSMRGAYFNWLVEQPAPSACMCVFRGDVIASAKGLGTYYMTRSSAQKIYDKDFSSLTVCADRVFGLDGNVVSYTVAGERDGWENGESITLPSPCDALVTVDGKVYALGNTCYKLAPDGEDVEFKFSVLWNNIGDVAPRSVVNYNGRAVFASKQGLYQIASDKLTPIFAELKDAVDFSDAQGIIYDGKYYLSCRTKNAETDGNDVTLALDLDEEKIVGIVDLGFGSMAAIKGTIYVTQDGHFYRIYEGVAPGKFVKCNVDFGTSQKKFLDGMTVTTANYLEVTIRSEKDVRVYKVEGKKSAQKINFRDMGWEFSIELSSEEGLKVENLTLFAHTLQEV